MSKEEDEKTYTLFQVSKHSSDDDLYVAVHGRVYNLTSFWRSHPGGSNLIRDRAGKSSPLCIPCASPYSHLK